MGHARALQSALGQRFSASTTKQEGGSGTMMVSDAAPPMPLVDASTCGTQVTCARKLSGPAWHAFLAQAVASDAVEL